jgi:cell division protein FtsN
MKRITVIGLSICFVWALTSCKSSESAYRKAYETAKQQELANKQKETTTEATTSEQTAVTPSVPIPKETDVRRERVESVSGNNAIKAYGIVCGSFGLKTNADALKNFLQSEGYGNATVIFSSAIVMYRVVVDSYDNKDAAMNARDAFKSKYPYRNDFQEAWIVQKM